MPVKKKEVKRRKRATDLIPVWGRVPRKHVDAVERALPKYGWRSRLIVHVFEHLASRVQPGTQPSMHTVEHIGAEAADQWFATDGQQYAQAVDNSTVS